MEEVIFKMTQEQLDRIVDLSAREGIRAYRNEQLKQRKREEKDRDKARRAKKMLQAYRRVRASLTEEEEFTSEEKLELRWRFISDLMGNAQDFAEKAELAVNNQERRRKENLYCIQCIEKAMDLYRNECEKSGSIEAQRRYREVYMMYIDETPYSVQTISEKENVAEKTVYKDIGIACDALAVYMLGV